MRLSIIALRTNPGTKGTFAFAPSFIILTHCNAPHRTASTRQRIHAYASPLIPPPPPRHQSPFSNRSRVTPRATTPLVYQWKLPAAPQTPPPPPPPRRATRTRLSSSFHSCTPSSTSDKTNAPPILTPPLLPPQQTRCCPFALPPWPPNDECASTASSSSSPSSPSST